MTASLSPPGVTLRMEEDSSEVGNGLVPFSTSSEATTGGGSLFVMTDMMVTVWTQFPAPTEYKGVQLPCLSSVRNSGSRQADNDKRA